MAGVANAEEPVTDLFGWPMPDGTGAGGSDPHRTVPPDNKMPDQMSGVPGVGTAMSLAAQTGPGENASPQVPGQNELGLPGASGDPGYVNSGAGDGHNLADQHRYNYQSQPGTNG